MRWDYELTINEANEASLTDVEYTSQDILYGSPEAWGSVSYVGTRLEWEEEIPLEEERARGSIWWNWMEEESVEWNAYRDKLLGELIPLTLTEKEEDK
tara:strand:+ start:371 stop:664 length:294 start_codon:yes stop_codon:yes gene_type:complete